MTRVEIPGAIGADCLTDGRFVASMRGGGLKTSGGDVGGLGEELLYPMMDAATTDVAGQGQQTGIAWKHDAEGWENAGTTFGVNPCIFDAHGALVLATVEQGSQGYRYVAPDGTLVTGDETVNSQTSLAQSYGLTGIWEWTHLGDLTIGQGETGCLTIGPHGRRMLELGGCFDINFHRVGSSCCVSMIKQQEDKAVFYFFQAEELASLPLETPLDPPIIIPPIDPPVHPPSEVGMKLPDNVYATLVSLRPKYPTPLGNHGAALLNDVAWAHRLEGYGLEAKPGGNSCPQPKTGEMCGCDILRTLTLGWDVLGDSEGAGVPNQSESGPADPARFVAPVDPGTFVPPVDPPIPPTGDLAARVAALENWRAQIAAVSR